MNKVAQGRASVDSIDPTTDFAAFVDSEMSKCKNHADRIGELRDSDSAAYRRSIQTLREIYAGEMPNMESLITPEAAEGILMELDEIRPGEENLVLEARERAVSALG